MKTILLSLMLTLAGLAQAQSLQLDKQGLSWRSASGQALDRIALRAKRWDQRSLPGDGGATALLQDANSGDLLWVEAQGDKLKLKQRWRPADIEIDCLALYRDAQGLLQALLLGADGRSQQWLLADRRGPQLLRPWASPPKPQACAVRDAEAQLYVLEEGVGLWQLPADAEADETRRLLQAGADLPGTALADWLAAHPPQPQPDWPTLRPLAQTEPMAERGDAADDPAIWLHPRQPGRSLILGTNKKQGLYVYDLQGRLRQRLAVGRINNVDLRQGLDYAGQRWDLAVATQRDEAGIVLFGISAQGRVSELARLPSGLDEVYGVCSLRNPAGRLEMVVNDKDGRVRQFELLRQAGAWRTELRREFRLASQPEGCVADEAGGQLFIGEEKRGVWRLPLQGEARPELAVPLGPTLQADVEGLAVYRRGAEQFLLVSSQGSDSYALFDLAPPHRPRGAFRIGLNPERGIDGASETDGLELSSADLGGPYREGLLVVQDGRKRWPLAGQNFKLLPWTAVRQALR